MGSLCIFLGKLFVFHIKIVKLTTQSGAQMFFERCRTVNKAHQLNRQNPAFDDITENLPIFNKMKINRCYLSVTIIE